MNEVIGPIYYVFASDPNKEWQGVHCILIFATFCLSSLSAANVISASATFVELAISLFSERQYHAVFSSLVKMEVLF